jgi:CRP-like cAMP-binding protein
MFPGSLLKRQLPITNKILRSLPRGEMARLSGSLKLVSLPLHSLLNDTAKRIAYGYFINSGLTSILTVLRNGKLVEVGLTGVEGFVGLPLVAGLRTSSVRVVVQLKAALRDSPRLRNSLLQYAQELAAQSAQIAACNRLHDANQRLARWLLMSQDRLGTDIVRLTQDFLAHMLGMRRASVTVALGFLRKKGMISYVRGAVTILHRSRLEKAACECYAAIHQHSDRWQKETR